MTLGDLVRAHLTVAHENTIHAGRAAALLDAQPIARWPALIARDPQLQTIGGLHQVLDRATREIYNDPATGLYIIDAVLALPIHDVVLRGRALRLKANALHQKSEGTLARNTLRIAMSLLGTEPAGILELLHARLFEAYLRSETDNADVLLDVRVIAREFAARGDARGALHARVMEAAILFNRDKFSRAMRVNREALTMAEALKDEFQQAIILNNLGQCAQQLALNAHRDRNELRARAAADEALSYFARATPRYAALGMDGESQKIVWAMAGIAQQRGHLAEARAQLLQVREEFLRRSMFLAAALVGLDLIELLIMVNRHDLIVPWYDEVLATFTRAGMPRYALEALERVGAVAAAAQLDARVLAEVRSNIRERFAVAA